MNTGNEITYIYIYIHLIGTVIDIILNTVNGLTEVLSNRVPVIILREFVCDNWVASICEVNIICMHI